MRTILFKYVTVLFLTVPLMLSAGHGKLKGKYTKEKTIKKEFDVNSDALLKVRNSYGNLNLTSWEGNKVMIEVHIKTNGNNEDKVQKKLNEITPIKNSVHLNNDYGNIILDRIDGHAKINCDYGRLEIGELRGRNNQLNFDYTSKSTIDFINSGTINADYSGFTIGKAGDLIIKADYTNSTVEKMGNLDYNTDYGKLEIGEADNVQGTGDYIGVKLGTYDSQYHFNFEIKTSYGSVSGKDDFQMNISEVKNTSKYYRGHYGSANSGNSVNISSDYGGVTFTKN